MIHIYNLINEFERYWITAFVLQTQLDPALPVALQHEEPMRQESAAADTFPMTTASKLK